MSRRLLTAGLPLAVLLGFLAWTARAAAKPPDLPLVNNDVLGPAAPTPPNPFPPAAAPAAPAMEAASPFHMRPSARRMLTSCLLYGVHPLLTLAPTDEYFDFDDDEAPELPVVFTAPAVQEAPHGTITIGVGVNSDAGLTGSIEWSTPSAMGAFGCSGVIDYFLQLAQHLKPDGAAPQKEEPQDAPYAPNPNGPCGFNPSHLISGMSGPGPLTSDLDIPINPQPEPIPVAPKEAAPDAPAESVCPWMRQHGAPPQEAPAADFNVSHDVLHNLEMLRQAQSLLEDARDFGRAGRVSEALECLDLVRTLCPGSRIDDAVQQTAAELFAPFFCGSPSGATGADEVPVLYKKEKEPEREIDQKLKQPVSLHFEEAPLRQVIDDIRASQDIDIYVDKASLESEEVSLDQPISIKFDNISLRSTLSLILKQAHLTYVIKDGLLQVTTERGARGRMEHVVYSVADLLDGDAHDGPEAPAGKSPQEALIKLIIDTIDPQEWSVNGGRGTIDFHPPTRSLVINQTADVQEQVVDLLNDLRRQQDRHDEEPEERCTGFHLSQDVPDEPNEKARSESIAPCLPPVDPDTPAALDQLLHESYQSSPPGDTEEPEPPSDAAKGTAKPMLELPHGSFEFGIGLDGSVQMFTQFHRGGAVWHLYYGSNGLSVWASPVVGD